MDFDLLRDVPQRNRPAPYPLLSAELGGNRHPQPHHHQHQQILDKTIGTKLIMATTSIVKSLYRRSLKLSLDWSIRRDVWRPQALNIRELFEANRDVREPRQLSIILQEAEEALERWKHPDPYTAPTAPGGSKYERNLPCPILDPPAPLH
ncbi:hypothetical protein HOY82DRAFT_576615 [Tuber indicum]|nr:hypothetical protein HOY82DRAFT_576615 [Tuber indicum]